MALRLTRDARQNCSRSLRTHPV